MKISIQNHQKIFNFFLILLASTIVFRITNTWIIIVFTIYNLFNLDKLLNVKSHKNYILLISSPFIVHLLFFWNTSSFFDELKSIEKYVSLLIFSVFFIGNYKIINFYFILKSYIIIFTLLLIIFYFRFGLLYPSLFNKYEEGVDIWERGYSFSDSFYNHAPIINMHIAFALVCSYYLAINSCIKRQYLKFFLFSVNCVILIFFLFYINTRLALLNSIIGLIFISGFYCIKYFKFKALFPVLIFIIFIISTALFFYVQKNPFMIKKYTTVTFIHMDKIGKLDEVKNPEAVIFSSLVTRLSIWKSTVELIKKKPFIGYGASNSRKALLNYYKSSNQLFLNKYKFPVHNQYLDFTLKFGGFGFLVLMLYLYSVAYVGFVSKNILSIIFLFIFSISNFTDDLMIRFHGIVYSGFWISLFVSFFLTQQSLKSEID